MIAEDRSIGSEVNAGREVYVLGDLPHAGHVLADGELVELRAGEDGRDGQGAQEVVGQHPQGPAHLSDPHELPALHPAEGYVDGVLVFQL